MREAGLKAAEEAAAKMDAASDPDAVKAALERIRSNVIEHGETSKKNEEEGAHRCKWSKMARGPQEEGTTPLMYSHRAVDAV